MLSFESQITLVNLHIVGNQGSSGCFIFGRNWLGCLYPIRKAHQTSQRSERWHAFFVLHQTQA